MSEQKKHPSRRRYPLELRERAVRMVHEAIAADGTRTGVLPRVARQLGIGVPDSCLLSQLGAFSSCGRPFMLTSCSLVD